MKTIKINHIYECYPLYKELYSTNLYHKAYDTMTAAIALEKFVEENNVKNLRILELFSGKSEHKDMFLKQFGFPERIKSYYCLDKYAKEQESKEVISADALNFNYSEFNVILSFFYSLNGTFIQDSNLPRQSLDEFFGNLYRTLKPKSVAFFNIGVSDIRFSLEQVDEPTTNEISLRPNCSLLTKFEIKNSSATLKYKVETYYDRLTCCNYTTFSNVGIFRNKEKLVSIQIKKPFIHRFWAENEIVDSLRCAGFKNLKFYHNSMSEEDLPSDELKQIVKYPDCPSAFQEVEKTTKSMTSTDLLVIR